MTEQKTPRVTPVLPEKQNGEQRFTSGSTERRVAPVPTQDGKVNTVKANDVKDVGGWDAYRRWLSRVQLPDKRRTSMDPALYTWKGYRNWAERVRRDWSHED